MLHSYRSVTTTNSSKFKLHLCHPPPHPFFVSFYCSAHSSYCWSLGSLTRIHQNQIVSSFYTSILRISLFVFALTTVYFFVVMLVCVLEVSSRPSFPSSFLLVEVGTSFQDALKVLSCYPKLRFHLFYLSCSFPGFLDSINLLFIPITSTTPDFLPY